MPLDITIIGLTITSSWGNGHATTYRGLVRELTRRKHNVLFLEHDKPWYSSNRDLPHPPFGRTELYSSIDDLKDRFESNVRNSDLVIVGSYVSQGIEVGHWTTQTASNLTAFYDIDTPVTLTNLQRGACEYLSADLIPKYDLYLSFTGGPTLRRLETEFGSPRALPLYCSVDPDLYYPQPLEKQWDLGYLGTYSPDRQPPLEKLLIDPARRSPDKQFVVAGPQYPDSIDWPPNIHRINHLAPANHRAFYNQQSFTLNITRADMIRAGYSPSVRLFEAAACGVPIISDHWDGIETFFEPEKEILIAASSDDVLSYLTNLDQKSREQIARRARQRILNHHTAAHRALELEQYILNYPAPPLSPSPGTPGEGRGEGFLDQSPHATTVHTS